MRTPTITLNHLFYYYDFFSQAHPAGKALSPLKPITVERFKDYMVQLRDLEIIKIAKLGDGEKAPEIADIHDDWWSDAVIQALDETPPKENAEKEVGREALQRYEGEVSPFLDAYSELPPHQIRSNGELKRKKYFDNMRFEAIKELVDKTEEENERSNSRKGKQD